MFEKISDKTREILFMNPAMHMESNREVIIENCERIEEYNEVFMQLVSGRLCIRIWGNGLRAYDFRTGGLVVKGRISRIEFDERNKKRYAKNDKRLHKD